MKELYNVKKYNRLYLEYCAIKKRKKKIAISTKLYVEL